MMRHATVLESGRVEGEEEEEEEEEERYDR
jgi:hypothetical protein